MAKSFEDLLGERLNTPVLDKQGNTVKNRETGEDILPMEMMVMSVMNEAMRGSIPHIAFVRNMSKEFTDEEAHLDACIEKKKAAVKYVENEILNLGGKLTCSSKAPIEMAAETKLLLDKINEQMAAPDFQPVISDVSNNGTMKTTVHPIIALRDAQQKKLAFEISEIYNRSRLRR